MKIGRIFALPVVLDARDTSPDGVLYPTRANRLVRGESCRRGPARTRRKQIVDQLNEWLERIESDDLDRSKFVGKKAPFLCVQRSTCESSSARS